MLPGRGGPFEPIVDRETEAAVRDRRHRDRRHAGAIERPEHCEKIGRRLGEVALRTEIEGWRFDSGRNAAKGKKRLAGPGWRTPSLTRARGA